MDDTALAGWVASSLAYLTGTCTGMPWTDATSERTEPMSTEHEAQMAKVYAYLRKVGAAYADQIGDATGVPPETLKLAAGRLELSNLYGQYSLLVQTSFDSPDDDD